MMSSGLGWDEVLDRDWGSERGGSGGGWVWWSGSERGSAREVEVEERERGLGKKGRRVGRHRRSLELEMKAMVVCDVAAAKCGGGGLEASRV